MSEQTRHAEAMPEAQTDPNVQATPTTTTTPAPELTPSGYPAEEAAGEGEEEDEEA